MRKQSEVLIFLYGFGESVAEIRKSTMFKQDSMQEHQHAGILQQTCLAADLTSGRAWTYGRDAQLQPAHLAP